MVVISLSGWAIVKQKSSTAPKQRQGRLSRFNVGPSTRRWAAQTEEGRHHGLQYIFSLGIDKEMLLVYIIALVSADLLILMYSLTYEG